MRTPLKLEKRLWLHVRAAVGSEAYEDALRFAQHAVAQDAKALVAVYFSGLATRCSLRGDSNSLPKPWQGLAEASGCELLVCAASALEHKGEGALELARDFEASGVAELIDNLEQTCYLCFQ